MGKTIKKLVGLDDSAAKKAARAQEEAARQAEEARIAQETMRENFAADLTLDNIATVEAGGTAELLGAEELRRKRRSGAGLSSQLGIAGG